MSDLTQVALGLALELQLEALRMLGLPDTHRAVVLQLLLLLLLLRENLWLHSPKPQTQTESDSK